MTMHPYISSRVSQEHIADMHRAADQSRQAAVATGPRAPGRGRPVVLAPAALRNRAGWTLVHLGLRLVSGSADG
jgi:hypothetical protein